jgi:small subunit ribosomal protein S2
MNMTTSTPNTESLEALYSAGAHYGLARSRRHPSVSPYVYVTKDRVDIFNLDQTSEMLERAKDFVRTMGKEGKNVLFVGGKPESHTVVKQAAMRAGAPYCLGRWVGGTLTNFVEIKKRIGLMQDLISRRDGGSLGKYTKFERLQIDRQIEKLEGMYAGLVELGDKLPDALFIVDSRREINAVREAQKLNTPILALTNSDCNLSEVQYPIPANDASKKSIVCIVDQIVNAYIEGQKEKTSAPIVAPRA